MEDYLYEEYSREQMTEEQKKTYELEKENKRLREQFESQKKDQETKEIAVLKEQYIEQYDKEFESALNEVNVPKNPHTIARMAKYMEDGLKENIEISAVQAAKLVQEDYENEAKAVYSKLPPEQLIKLFGEDLVKKLHPERFQ